MGCAGCNGAALSRHLDGLLFGKGSAKGKPALLVVQTGQPGERQSVKGLFSRTLCSGSDVKHGPCYGIVPRSKARGQRHLSSTPGSMAASDAFPSGGVDNAAAAPLRCNAVRLSTPERQSRIPKSLRIHLPDSATEPTMSYSLCLQQFTNWASGKAQSHFDHPLHSPTPWLEAAQWWPQCLERCRPILGHGDSVGLYLAGSVLSYSRAQ